MGFFLRKSASVGPLRFNFSGSGVGVSAGVRGLRVGTGPRGNYVHMGRGGIYYKHTFASPAQVVSPSTPPMHAIDSGAAAEIVDASSEDFLQELRARKRRLSLRPVAIAGAVVLVMLGFATGLEWMVVACVVAGLALIVAAGARDRRVKTTVIQYDFEPRAEEAFRRFTEWAQALAGVGRIWNVDASARAFDRKYHAGAGSLVQRSVAVLRTAAPPFLRTNVPVLSMSAGRQMLYFLPDRLLVSDANGIGAVSYRTLELHVARTRFIEDTFVPADATVVDRTWQYVNKSGGPDRRFANNRQIPICLYDELSFRTPSGLNETFHVSRAGIAEGFVAAVRHLATVGGTS